MFAKNNGEYFIIENRRRSGRDLALPDEGLAIWHVDEDGDNSNEQMTPARHYELSLKQADGKSHLEMSRHHYGDDTDLYGEANTRFADSTAPSSKWWDGSASHLDIFEVTAPGDVVRFRAKLFEDGTGEQSIRRESTPGQAIPDNAAGGVADTIAIDQDAIIASAKVTLDITHSYRGDLRVTLQAPWGDEIRLHERNQGGSADHIKQTFDEANLQALATLHGRNTRGDWRLLVQDLAAADVGTLNRWALEFTTAGQPQSQIVLEEAPGTHIPDNNPAGIQRTLTITATGTIASVEVSVAVTHSYIADLRISLRSPAGTEVILHNETGGSADNVVKTYTNATTAALGNLAGQPINGAWRLDVSDRAGQDVGKLNHWRLVISRAL